MKRLICLIGILLVCGMVFGDLHYSVVHRIDDFRELAAEFMENRRLMEEYSRDVLDYFKRKLGWHNPSTGQFGFHTGNHEIYFYDTFSGFNIYDLGTRVGSFSSSYSAEWDTFYLSYNPPGNRHALIGYQKGKVSSIKLILEDGFHIQFWGTGSIKIIYENDDEIYAIYNYHKEAPVFQVSPLLARAIFFEKQPRFDLGPIISGIINDFPYPYYTRILKDLIAAKVDPVDTQKTAQFTVNWFRNIVGIHPAEVEQRLVDAAQNHAKYNVTSGTIRKMLTWDYETVDLNDYLEFHTETKGVAGFTGESVQDRTEFTGYGRNSGECANMTRTDAITDVIAWFHNIFHRRAFIDYRVVHMGYGFYMGPDDLRDTSGIMNWGYGDSVKSGDYYLYPADGEEMVPYAWSGMEAPDPFPELDRTFGTPIMVYYSDPIYYGGDLRLFDEDGREVELIKSQVLLHEKAFLERTPAKPLKPDTKYTVEFFYSGVKKTTTFKTAPLNPAETLIRGLVDGFAAEKYDFRVPGFNLQAALELNNKLGPLSTFSEAGSTRVKSEKYGFSLALPAGWEVSPDREWQEVKIKIKDGWYNINVMLYNPGMNRTPEKVRGDIEPQQQYPMIADEPVDTGEVRGYLAFYDWEHDNGVTIAYLVWDDYALAIYGYGAPEEDFRLVLDSFRSER